MSTTEATVDDGDRPNALVNALLGGVAAIVLAALPFSPVLGGALAGYLQGTDARDGLRVGALAGVVAVVPLALLFVLFGGFLFAFVPVGMGMIDPSVGVFGAVGVFVLLGFLVFGLGYTVGLAALGGVLGAYLRRELD
ncbi:MAG: DUF5518 domain-containing protein [Haloarculaceae archaeon]|jgi:hypothetical protein